MTWNDIHNRQHCIHNVFKFQSFLSIEWFFMHDILKFDEKFGILFVQFSPNSVHRTCFLSNNTWSYICWHTVLSRAVKFLHGFTHTQKQIFLIVVSRKLLRLASSTASKDSLMLGITINNCVVSLGLLLSYNAQHKISNSFALFLSSLCKLLLTPSTRRIIVAWDELTVLETVPFPDKSLALCVANIFLLSP